MQPILVNAWEWQGLRLNEVPHTMTVAELKRLAQLLFKQAVAGSSCSTDWEPAVRFP